MKSCGSCNKGKTVAYADISDIRQGLSDVLWCRCGSERIRSMRSTILEDLDGRVFESAY
jgi:phage baseplate assembly protein W